MQAKPLTLSVIVVAVISAVGLVSGQIDQQEAAEAARPVALQPSLGPAGIAPPISSPVEIDPRRMEAPPAIPTRSLSIGRPAGRRLLVSSAI